ncbi:MAG: T9SS type A sorting domain-containing protein [Bacteroidales bacterium]|nr:T9SS type A sorting domain-containing protein [Bacteroidales bacterium]
MKELKIYNCLGSPLIHREIVLNSIDISQLLPGLYIIEVLANKTIMREKFLVR